MKDEEIQLKARLMATDRRDQILDELPEQIEDYDCYVELHNTETRKSKVLAASSPQKAENFVKIFNLISNFCFFDHLVVT